MKYILKEIDNIANYTKTFNDEALKKYALTIASLYLKTNEPIDPITLSRAAFFIALKRYNYNLTEKIEKIIDCNGIENRWWIYLAPIIEKIAKNKF